MQQGGVVWRARRQPGDRRRAHIALAQTRRMGEEAGYRDTCLRAAQRTLPERTARRAVAGRSGGAAYG